MNTLSFVELAIIDGNIKRAQVSMVAVEMKCRPHIKTQKNSITRQKINRGECDREHRTEKGEAEAMTNAVINMIPSTRNILGKG